MAVMSPSVWWDRRVILRRVEALLGLGRAPNLARRRDRGRRLPHQVVEDARRLRDAFVAKGWREGIDLKYCEVNGAGHNEQAWAARFGWVLQYLFPR